MEFMVSEPVAKRGTVWSRDETILALGLYFQMPIGKMHARNEVVVRYANQIGRTPAALSMKMCNIGRFDPNLAEQGIVGLSNGGKMDKLIWDEFASRPDAIATEFRRVLMALETGSDCVTEHSATSVAQNQIIDVRLNASGFNQAFFRSGVLAAYDNKCCITGIDTPQLLIANHIKPLASCETENERVDVENGLCLSPLYSQAFLLGLMTIDLDYHIVLSHDLKETLSQEKFREHFLRYDNQLIALPQRSRPGRRFLEFHNAHVFRR